MAELTIYRGTHNIGGCCTEITAGGERILIDLGANLPGSDAPITDEQLVAKVFDGRPVAGLLFTHPHGDHYGLYKKVLENVPMYIGPMAKEILEILVSRLDYVSKEKGLPEEKGLPIVKQMKTYEAGKTLDAFENIQVLPLYVDHSAPDAYMFYIQTEGKKILYSGDFRDHGIMGEKDRLWRMLEKYVPKGIDLLITEGTMLSRETKTGPDLVQTEAQLGEKAEEYFRKHKYNFVLVSSTNLDSIMEFYLHTPEGMSFVCDAYQAEVMLTAMKWMECRRIFPQYRRPGGPPPIRVLQVQSTDRRLAYLRVLRSKLKRRIRIETAPDDILERDGFVMLVRKNSDPNPSSTVFKEMRDKFYPLDGQIIYSMWDGYLEPEHADKALLDYIGNRQPVHLHTSGHAYVETIAKLIETVQPKTIVPMHTEKADEFTSIPAFAAYRDRVKVLHDGEKRSLDQL